MTFNHTECARAWAKVLAYKRVGNEAEARAWWLKLESMLGYGDAREALAGLLQRASAMVEPGYAGPTLGNSPEYIATRAALAPRGWDRLKYHVSPDSDAFASDIEADMEGGAS